MKNLIFILWLSAKRFASLLGLTLKPIRIALDALARVTSVSVITPIFDKIIFGVISVKQLNSVLKSNIKTSIPYSMKLGSNDLKLVDPRNWNKLISNPK